MKNSLIRPVYYAPGPVASAFLKSDARRRVLMGPFGSGKSVACCHELLRRAREQAPDSRGVRRTRFAVIRNTYPELKSTTVKTWRAWFGDEFGKFSSSIPFEHRLRFGLRGDGTRVECDVVFLAMDQEADAKKFLSLEVTGIYFNEVRELSRAIVDAGDGRIGRYPPVKDGGPTWHGIIADTNMPDEDHWLYDLAEVEQPEGWAFFRQPGGVRRVETSPGTHDWVANPHAENLPNLIDGYYTAQLPGKEDAWVAVYLGAEYGRLPVEGAYFAEELATAERERRIATVLPDPQFPVHTFWDLGVSDDTTIWFGQGTGGEWRWVDYYENSGQSLDHYAAVLKARAAERRWSYGDHIWPHDGGQRDPGILGGRTRRDVFEQLGFKATVLPRQPLADGIDAARRLIRVSRFDADRCRDGLTKLRRYRRARDAARNVFLDRPEHDDNSHAADAFRAAAMGRDRVSNTDAWSNADVDPPAEWVV
ncbi:MAG: hypothetical protein KDE14_03285 [Rhodobacteraceae bacterium]|nr:hypothetical protein [Paracoccaceae bacterium]